MNILDLLDGAERRITELEAGSCRFNCRTVKENWIEGFMAGATYDATRLPTIEEVEFCYDEWKRQQKKTDPRQGDVLR